MSEARKSQKEMTKAERRALQEKQRAAKQQAKDAGGVSAGGTSGSGGGGGGGGGGRPKPIPGVSVPKGGQSGVGSSGGDGLLSSVGGPSSSDLRVGSPPANTPLRSAVRFTTSSEDASKRRAKMEKAGRTPAQKPVLVFSHLPQFERDSNVLEDFRAQGSIHPAIVNLGIQFQNFIITGGSARCLAMLLAFKKVISDYVTPAGTSLQRNLTSHLSKQIEYLSMNRCLADSMKTAIKLLKSEILKCSIDQADEDVKASLKEWIDEFIKERITVAAKAIIEHALKKIRNGDVILTYARSSVVEKLLLAAHEAGVNFRVIVCDSRPRLEGKVMLERLVERGIHCTYVLSNSLGVVIKEVTKVFIGASALLSNGAVMSRVGTAVVAMMASDAHVPVIVLCELLKFSEIVRLDSFVWNEIGDPDELLRLDNPAPSAVLPLMLPAPKTVHDSRVRVLKDWRDVPKLKLLNLHYDVTPASFITMVVCENGFVPSTSVLSVLNKEGGRKESQ